MILLWSVADGKQTEHKKQMDGCTRTCVKNESAWSHHNRIPFFPSSTEADPPSPFFLRQRSRSLFHSFHSSHSSHSLHTCAPLYHLDSLSLSLSLSSPLPQQQTRCGLGERSKVELLTASLQDHSESTQLIGPSSGSVRVCLREEEEDDYCFD
jgi:hypothetical protein